MQIFNNLYFKICNQNEDIHSFPTRRSSDLMREIKRHWPETKILILTTFNDEAYALEALKNGANGYMLKNADARSEEHTSELQSRGHLVCRLLLEKKKNKINN